MTFDRRVGLGKTSKGIILGVLAVLVWVTSVEAATNGNVGKVPVGYPTLEPVCYCVYGLPSGYSAQVTSVSLSGSGGALYSVASTGNACITNPVTYLTGTATLAMCNALDALPIGKCGISSYPYSCVYYLQVDPLHPGPLPSATLTTDVTFSDNTTASHSQSLQGIGGIILAPADSTRDNPDIFPLSTPQTSTDPGTASITFTAANLQAADTITWKTTTAYTTSGGESVPSSTPTPFVGSPNQSIMQSFTGVGGKMTVNATAEGYTDTATVYITGTAISTSYITQVTTNMYNPQTGLIWWAACYPESIYDDRVHRDKRSELPAIRVSWRPRTSPITTLRC